MIQRQLEGRQALVCGTVDSLQQKQEERDLAARRRDELDLWWGAFKAEYEGLEEKSFRDEETLELRSMEGLKNKREAHEIAGMMQ